MSPNDSINTPSSKQNSHFSYTRQQYLHSPDSMLELFRVWRPTCLLFLKWFCLCNHDHIPWLRNVSLDSLLFFPDYTCSVFLRSLLLWGWPFGHVTMHSPFTGSYWSPGPTCGHWGRWCLLLSCSGKSQNNFIMWSWSLEFLLLMVQELDIHPCVIHGRRPASPREPIEVLDVTYLRFHSQATSLGPFFF